MASWRSIRRQARRDLHKTMRVPAFYYAPGGGAVAPCTVRVWQGFTYLGDMKGTSFDYAEYGDNTPRIITMDSEIIPERLGVFSVEPGEAYRVDRREPKDDITSISHVVRLDKDEAAGLLVPDGYDESGFAPPYDEEFARLFGYPEDLRVSVAMDAPADMAPGTPFVPDFTGAETVRDTRTGARALHEFFDADRFRPLADGDEYLLQFEMSFAEAAPGNGVTVSMDVQPPATPAPSAIVARAFPAGADTFVTVLPVIVTAGADMVANGARFSIEVGAAAKLLSFRLGVGMRAP